MTATLTPPTSPPPPRDGQPNDPSTRSPRTRPVSNDVSVLNSGVRRTLLSLLACILGSLPLIRLVHSGSWLIGVWVAMTIAILPALLFRLRRPPGALQIWPGLLLLVFWL